MELSPRGYDSIGLGHLEGSDKYVSLTDAHVSNVPLEYSPFLHTEHVGVIGNVANILGFQGYSSLLPKSQSRSGFNDVGGTDF